MKKVLILTVTAGGGHNACAYAMKRVLESSGTVQVEVVDLVNAYSTPLNKFLTDRGYCIAVAKLLHTYNKFYDKYRAVDPTDRYKCPSQGTVVSVLEGLLKKIIDFKPDVIYSTHFYGSIAVTDLKLICNLPCKSVATCLDFVNSPFWEAGIGVDYLNVPNDDFTDVFMGRGFEKSQLLTYGIPVRALPENSDKTAIRRQLSLNEQDFTVLIMFGGGYWKGGYKLLKSLMYASKDKRVQIVAINGNDKKSYKKTERLRKKLIEYSAKSKRDDTHIDLINLGFIDNVPQYLAASDVALTKCGGVSSCEMVNAGLPMIVTETLPGQELYNLHYLKGKGVALSFKNRTELHKTFDDVYSDREILQRMRACSDGLKSYGVKDLADFIVGLPDADYSDFKTPDLKKVKSLARKRLKEAYHNEKNAARN